jgi:hypothetical protein
MHLDCLLLDAFHVLLAVFEQSGLRSPAKRMVCSLVCRRPIDEVARGLLGLVC